MTRVIKIKKDTTKKIISSVIFILILIWIFYPMSNNDKFLEGNTNNLIEEKESLDYDNFSNINKLHWTQMPLTYHYDSSCHGPIISRIELAFDIITNETDSFVRFERVEGDADINFLCYPHQNVEALISQDATRYTFGLASSEIYGNRITRSTIEFWSIRNNSMPPDCYTFPSLTIHEILHVLGFGHDETNRYSVMYPYGGSECIDEDNRTITITATGETFIPKNEIDKKIVSCLKYIYSNGEEGFCGSDVNFLENLSQCSDGWYNIEGTEYCCPEPNMRIVNGYCDY